MKDAKEYIVVASGQGRGNDVTQMYYPREVGVHQFGNLYVVDYGNCRMQGCRRCPVPLNTHRMKKLIHNLLLAVFLYDRPFSKPESHNTNSILSLSQHDEVQRLSLKHKDNAFIELFALNHRFFFIFECGKLVLLRST